MATTIKRCADVLRRGSMILIGLGLLGLSLANVVASDAEVWLRLVESGLPIGLSLVFLAFGVMLQERGMGPEPTVVVAAWALSGAVVTGALAVWLLAVVALGGQSITDPSFVVASAATVGATFGGAAGYYHAELQRRTAELRRQNVRLDEFASIVSHDLRNPLSVATGGLDLARETGADDDFERVERAHQRMDRMVAELLELARQGADVSDLEPVSLREAVDAARTTVDGDLAVTAVDDWQLRADPERLAAVFENLFRNAAEHAGPDPTVTVGTVEDGAGFFVADDGPGIPTDAQGKVFEHGYTTRDGGTGIGLAIVRRIADAHGWRIAVTRSDAGGARFEFRV